MLYGLFADGVLVQGTEMDGAIATAGEFENVSFDKKIKVCCKGTLNLAITSLPTVVYSGGATPVVTDTEPPILKNSEISVTRLA